LIAEVETKDDEMKIIKEKKRVLGKKIHDKIEEKNKLSARIDEVKEKQKNEKGEEAPKQEVKKEDKPKHPLTLKIEKIKDDIEKLRKNKSNMKEEHEKAYQSWREQNELNQKIKWIKNKKSYLLREKQKEEYEAKLKEEEAKRKAEIEEYEKLYGKPKKYQPQIDICDNLLSYLSSRIAKDDAEGDNQEVTYDSKDVEGQLKGGDWKKEKVHILKKEDENMGLQPGQGKKKGKKRKNEAKAEEKKFEVSTQTQDDFDQVKVAPPKHFKDIANVLKELETKKAYFIKISDDINDGKQVETEDAKPEESKEEQAEKPAPKPKREKVNLDDDEMFPAMGC